jgi:hypothetical protein
MVATSRLLRPLDYWRIKHPAKSKYDLWLPLGLAFLFTSGLYLLPISVPIFAERGLISIISELLQILTGFYIASLAAIATFNKEGMDSTMPGDPPTLKTMYRGKIKIIELSRRRFLCLMFGYLSFMGILLYFLGSGANLLRENAIEIIPFYWRPFAKWGFITFYLFLVSNLVVTTLLGLFYMADRIHRTDPTLSQGESVPSEE